MARQALTVLLVVIAFGILVPIYKGVGFLDPRIIAAYSFLSVLFVAPASVEFVATHGRNAAPGDILSRIGIIVAWGWGITVLILGTAIVTLNVETRRGGFAIPPLGFISAVLAFSLIASIAVAMLGAVLARRFSASQVKTILRAAFLIVLIALILAPRILPEDVTLAIFDRFHTRRALTRLAWEASAVLAIVAALLSVTILRGKPPASLAADAKPV